jgi:hypothetical protein
MPLATAGEDSKKYPVVYRQCRRRFGTVAGLRTNSYGLKPVRQGTKPNSAQFTTALMGDALHGRLGGGTAWAVAIEPIIMSKPNQQEDRIFIPSPCPS